MICLVCTCNPFYIYFKVFVYDIFTLDYRACATRSMLSAVTKFGPIFEKDFSYDKADELAERVIEAVRDLKPIEAIQELQAVRSF